MDLCNLCFIPADVARLTIESRRVAKSTTICPKTGQEISTPVAYILDIKVDVLVDGKTYTTEMKDILYKDANSTLDEVIKASFIHAIELEKEGTNE